MATVNFRLALETGLAGLVWGLRRTGRMILRQVGGAGLLVAACCALSLAAVLYQRHAQTTLSALVARQVEVRAKPVARAIDSATDDAARLAEFRRFLAAPEEIPTVVQDLIGLAQRHGLQLNRGEYKAQPEMQGEFLRYQMVMPVKGSPVDVHAFLSAALRDNRSLALETVQFKREQIAANQVEARIQWTLLTRLPSLHGSTPAESRP